MIQTRPIKLAIASGKGGTGKTLVATNLFHALISSGIEANLADCDAEAPNAALFFKKELQRSYQVTQAVPEIDESLCTYCGKCHEYCHYNAIFILPKAKVIRAITELCHGCGACMFACKFGAIKERPMTLGDIITYSIPKKNMLIESRMKVGIYSPVRIIKEGIKAADNGTPLIMDAPPGTSCPFIQTVDRADFVVLVSEPTPFGLSDLKQSVAVLRKMDKPFGVIINRAGLGNHDMYDFLKQQNIPLLLEIPFDPLIAASYARGRLLTEKDIKWVNTFLSLYYNIMTSHGSSHHQR